MTSRRIPFVKVCCIADATEARAAIGAGAAALGLVSSMPSGPGVIDEATIALVAADTPPPIATFLLTALQRADAIVAQHARCRTSVLQLVDAVAHDELRRLREVLPAVKLVQVIHVTGPVSVDEAVALAPLVDALLLDSGNPTLAVKELGGTGRVHHWSLSRSIREQVNVPVWLAGGLRPDNVADAVRAVQPWGLDLCSGVRSAGRLDPAKLGAFMRALQSAA